MASAVPILRVANPQEHYAPSEIITIELYDPDTVIGMSFDAIMDDAGGVASEPQTFNTGLNLTQPGALNEGGHLVEYVFANSTTGGASGVLYTFDYHVPEVPVSTIITIGSYADGDLYWEPYFDYLSGEMYEGPLGSVAIHVIPEPATIALLGLGGLLLRRKK
ncbi:MAG: PEP-CTERM sorting domain-containing protein [Sedimentisphaerales bacterium]|nr:PEP-CTERM sorting domain-containing protein [Sedimentisphaerales bacterium]